MADEHDEEIALRIQQGNSDGFADLVERHYSPLIGYLYHRLGGNRPQAEDLAQETFVKVVCEIERYTYPRPFKPWLYAIATHLAGNYYQRIEKRYVTVEDDALDALPDEADGIEDGVARRAEIEQMARLLRRLPDLQREAVLLRYVEDFSLAEIAEVLDVPLGTAKSRVSLGLSRLGKLMRDSDKR